MSDSVTKSDIFSRTELLIGESSVEKLKNSCVAVFGVGGVGGYVCEMLARTGAGHISIFDSDSVSSSNRNRQIIALTSTLGRSKTEIMRERLLDINPDISVTAYEVFYDAETAKNIDLSGFDYIADCIDTVSSKLLLIESAKRLDVSIISAMGAGNKLDPTKFEVTDIYKTSVCPLARVMRRELKLRGIKNLKVVYSKEPPRKPITDIEENGRHIPASIAFCPAAMGIVMAREIVMEIAGGEAE